MVVFFREPPPNQVVYPVEIARTGAIYVRQFVSLLDRETAHVLPLKPFRGQFFPYPLPLRGA